MTPCPRCGAPCEMYGASDHKYQYVPEWTHGLRTDGDFSRPPTLQEAMDHSALERVVERYGLQVAQKLKLQ